jgi:hypothetical protein
MSVRGQAHGERGDRRGQGSNPAALRLLTGEPSGFEETVAWGATRKAPRTLELLKRALCPQDSRWGAEALVRDSMVIRSSG